MQVENGVQSSDRILMQYQIMMQDAFDLQKEIDEYFSSHESAIRDRVQLIDRLQQQLIEERRMLETQHHECRTQASHARKKQGVLRNEIARIEHTLVENVATLERDEVRIEKQLAAVDDRLHEIRQLTQALDERLARTQQEDQALEARERAAQQQEMELLAAIKELKLVEREIEERRRNLEQREGSISMWHRGLEAREAELNKCQQQYRENLRRIEQEEHLLGVNLTTPAGGSGWVAGSANSSAAGAPATSLSQHKVLDNNGMDIERDADEDCEEIE
jgi:hypothetical protein